MYRLLEYDGKARWRKDEQTFLQTNVSNFITAATIKINKTC
jgi:hypothetical protein